MEKIPQPPTLPFLKNLKDVDPSSPVQSITNIARKYPGLVKLDFPSSPLFIVSSQELVNELCDEKRFEKRVHLSIKHLKPLSGDGLFTAETKDRNWEKANRILVPAFAPASLRRLFQTMLEVVQEMLALWERNGKEEIIDVSDQMTRLTLDTIALASFDYRFNSFGRTELHPFVGAMLRSLQESGNRARRPEFVSHYLLLGSKRIFDRDNKYMHTVAHDLIRERKARSRNEHREDLLHAMLNSTDPVTGEKLDEDNIVHQLVTFLIAGHETTSGMLSFTIYELLKRPDVVARLRKEINDVIGSRTPTFDDLQKLPYMDQVFRESLRLWPTAPAFAVQSLAEKTVIGGKYEVKRDDCLMIMLPALHRDPKVWSDPETFDPDRMELAKLRALPPNSWKPFGNGKRACIGRGFAMLEANLALTLILQRFDLEAVDPNYQLVIKETLTMKPEGLFVRAKLRTARDEHQRTEG